MGLIKSYRSQKAKGLAVLGKVVGSLNCLGGLAALPILKVIQTEEDLAAAVFDPLSPLNIYYPVFARPCPARPRHGFVDSRVVKNYDQLCQVYKETMAADPEGELMLCSVIDATYNAVWTPNLLTVGHGNDGATAGKVILQFPLSGMMDKVIEGCLERADIKECPFVEVVWKDAEFPDMGAIYLTQLRDGPNVPALKDIIKTQTTVKKVLKPQGMDLLAWEQLILDYKGEDGVVVVNTAGAVSDHYSIHAVAAGIPLITSREVEVGDTLEVVMKEPINPMAVLRGAAAVDDFYDKDAGYAEYVRPILLALHNATAFGGDDGKWLGIAAALMLRFGSTALKGEVRHLDNDHGSRDKVYEKLLPYSLSRHQASVMRSVHALRYGQFPGASIGGLKWASCGAATIDLFEALREVAVEQSTASVDNLLASLNRAVNQAHNGGWWLNKFISPDSFDRVQQGHLGELLRSVPTLVKFNELYEKTSLQATINKAERWASWRPLHIKPVMPTAADITYFPGVGGLSFRVRDRVLKNRHRDIVITMPELVEILPPIINGQLYMVPGEHGLELELRKAGQLPKIVWKEKPISNGHTNV